MLVARAVFGWLRAAACTVAAPDPGGPFGAKGVGEDPIVTIGPAIANAIFDAIGVRFRHYPIKPEQVLHGLAQQRAVSRSAA